MGLKGWKYVREIQINNSSIGLQDYILCLELDSGNFDFSKPKPDGSDIRFTDSDGTTLLGYYIEDYDYINQKATIYVKIPSILANQTKSIYMYYGNPNAVSQSDQSIMNSGFQYNPDPFNDGSCLAFYPLDGDANDHSSNGHHGTWYGNEQYDKGVFGQAAKFNGNSHITTPLTGNNFPGDITISVWTKEITDNGDCQEIIQNRRDLNSDYYSTLSMSLDFRSNKRRINAYGGDGSSCYGCYYNLDNINWNEPHHIVAIRTDSEIKLYLDGTLVNSISSGSIYKGNNKYYIGGNYGTSDYYGVNGLIDHVHIFNRILSDDEIRILSNRLDCTISNEILQSKLSGVIYDKYRRRIKNKQVKIFIIDKDSGDLYGSTTSNNDGTWDILLPISPDTKVLTVMALEGEYHGDVDIAGAEYSTTKPSEN